jgi:hypothetical protein
VAVDLDDGGHAIATTTAAVPPSRAHPTGAMYPNEISTE